MPLELRTRSEASCQAPSDDAGVCGRSRSSRTSPRQTRHGPSIACGRGARPASGSGTIRSWHCRSNLRQSPPTAVDLALPGGVLGDVGHPEPIRVDSVALALDEVRRRGHVRNPAELPDRGDGGGGRPTARCSFRTASIRASFDVVRTSGHSRRAVLRFGRNGGRRTSALSFRVQACASIADPVTRWFRREAIVRSTPFGWPGNGDPATKGSRGPP